MSSSQRRDGRGVVVSELSVREALTEGRATLDQEEEHVLRLRHGAGVAADLPLEPKASGATLDTLRSLEVQLHQRYRSHLEKPRPQPSEAKDRIVRALRRKR